MNSIDIGFEYISPDRVMLGNLGLTGMAVESGILGSIKNISY